MPWFRIDDSFADHPKVMSIPASMRLRVTGLWATCGTWSAKHLTDGFIPAGMPGTFGGRPGDTRALVEARAHPGGIGLWIPADGGWMFHDWADYQPTRKDVEAKRRAGAERLRRFRERRARDGDGDDPETDGKRGV